MQLKYHNNEKTEHKYVALKKLHSCHGQAVTTVFSLVAKEIQTHILVLKTKKPPKTTSLLLSQISHSKPCETG